MNIFLGSFVLWITYNIFIQMVARFCGQYDTKLTFIETNVWLSMVLFTAGGFYLGGYLIFEM